MPLPPRERESILNPEIERLIYQVKVVQQDAEGVTYALTDEEFNWSPGPGRWSVGQCFDHLNAVDRSFLEKLGEAVADGRRRGLLGEGPYSYGAVSRWFFRLNEPPPKRRFKAPRKYAPAAAKPLAEVMPEFMSLHASLIGLLKQASGLDLARVRCPLPGLPILRLNLGMAFWSMTAHDRRHIYQAREICIAQGFPKSATRSVG
jgi:hypothetical protein